MQTKPIINIVNVVASTNINQILDLDKIQKKFPDAEYNADQFPGLVFRINNPKTATLLFSTGKMVNTGAKSEILARDAVKIVVNKLRKKRIKIAKDATVKIANIVSTANLGGQINIEKAARSIPHTMYEPEQFPGVIYRMLDPKVVMLLFTSGKVVIVGAKTESDVFRAVNNLHSMLEEKKLMSY